MVLTTSSPSTTAIRLIANSAAASAYGLLAYTHGDYSFIDIKNSATITVTTAGPGDEAFGIYAATEYEHSPITVQNKAAIAATGYGASGIYAYSLATTIPSTL